MEMPTRWIQLTNTSTPNREQLMSFFPSENYGLVVLEAREVGQLGQQLLEKNL